MSMNIDISIYIYLNLAYSNVWNLSCCLVWPIRIHDIYGSRWLQFMFVIIRNIVFYLDHRFFLVYGNDSVNDVVGSCHRCDLILENSDFICFDRWWSWRSWPWHSAWWIGRTFSIRSAENVISQFSNLFLEWTTYWKVLFYVEWILWENSQHIYMTHEFLLCKM